MRKLLALAPLVVAALYTHPLFGLVYLNPKIGYR